MEVSAEAKRIMVQALSKMYSSRAQRGGLRLHRSLLLTLVMKSARDIYHSARAACESPENQEPQENQAEQRTAAEPASEPPLLPPAPQPENQQQREESTAMEVVSSPQNVPEVPQTCTQPEQDQENRSPPRADRPSRKRRGKTATEPDFLPCKRAKMDTEVVLRILQDASLRTNAGNCARDTDTLPSTNPTHMPRTVATC